MKFCGTTTCDECPWRMDVPPGRFPLERFAALRATAEQGFGNKIFACHKTHEGEDQACVGFLLVAGHSNFAVRIAAIQGRFKYEELKATGPLFDSYAEMEKAQRKKPRKKK